MQLADGVDDDTWTYHLRQGDYTRWFREKIKDDALAQGQAAALEESDLSPKESRAQNQGHDRKSVYFAVQPTVAHARNECGFELAGGIGLATVSMQDGGWCIIY